MKRYTFLFISLAFLIPAIYGLVSYTLPDKPEKPVTQCYQYFCVAPPQVTTIYIYDISSGEPYLVGYCTTDPNTGCCPEPFLLDEGKDYNAKPVCQPYVQGVDFTACNPNPLTLECP